MGWALGGGVHGRPTDRPLPGRSQQFNLPNARGTESSDMTSIGCLFEGSEPKEGEEADPASGDS